VRAKAVPLEDAFGTLRYEMAGDLSRVSGDQQLIHPLKWILFLNVL